ncbi:MAG: penicillin-binding protein [Clostridia bacterium]|nr:penicillin-binding protein [Clostridia bacterium]
MVKGFAARYIVLVSVVVLVSSVFIARLVQWQIMRSAYYNGIAASSYEYVIRTDAVRGEIFDVNGKGLAVNLTRYNLVINRLYISDDRLNETISELVDITEKYNIGFNDELPIIFDKSGRLVFNIKRIDEARAIRKRYGLDEFTDPTANICIEKLAEIYDCKEYDEQRKRDIVSVRYGMENDGFSNTKPYVFAEGINGYKMTAIAERVKDISGAEVVSSAVRKYPDGASAPHIVGITGMISQEEYDELSEKGYSYNDMLGKSGIEAAFESELRGVSGSRTYEKDDDGNAVLTKTENTVPGNSVYLTIDKRLQKTAQQALKDAVKEANDYAESVGDENMGADCKGAAAVVLNVKDFSVLCAANYPYYDISSYYDDYTELAERDDMPLFDRALMGALTPGSTYKPLVAAAALQEGRITSRTKINCEGVYTKQGLSLWCMGEHGEQDTDNALVNSCNVFFAETGRLLGIENINKYAKRAGLGVKTGIELPESTGTLAGPEYSKLMDSEWYESYSSPAAIGQSDNQFTPMQLAVYAATIAGGGKRLRAHIVDRIVSYSGDEIIYKSEPEQLDDMEISKANMEYVQKAMFHAAQSYYPLYGYGISVAGKTGTAENSGSDHANFICYAPFDNPQIAVSVMVEHGAKSFVAINAAKKIIEAYFNL